MLSYLLHHTQQAVLQIEIIITYTPVDTYFNALLILS